MYAEDSKPSGGDVPWEAKTLYCFLVFFSVPVGALCYLAQRPSVGYWMNKSAYIGLLVALWLLFCYQMLCRKSLRYTSTMLLMTILPSTALIFVANYHLIQAEVVSTHLVTEDCFSFPEKANLQHAWEAAHTILVNCVAKRINETGAPLEQVVDVTFVHRCWGYEEALPSWRKEWAYLEDLEEQQQCAGWCTLDTPLWNRVSGRVYKDRCSTAAAAVMRENVYSASVQVMTYCCILIVGFSIKLTAFTDGEKV